CTPGAAEGSTASTCRCFPRKAGTTRPGASLTTSPVQTPMATLPTPSNSPSTGPDAYGPGGARGSSDGGGVPQDPATAGPAGGIPNPLDRQVNGLRPSYHPASAYGPRVNDPWLLELSGRGLWDPGAVPFCWCWSNGRLGRRPGRGTVPPDRVAE